LAKKSTFTAGAVQNEKPQEAAYDCANEWIACDGAGSCGTSYKMIIEVPGNSTDNDTQKGSQEKGGFNELLKCSWFLFYFARLFHRLKIYAAKIRKIY
jgi:hypothetical protein